MDNVQQMTVMTFEGSTVDEWLSGLTFEATIPPEGKGIVIRVIGSNAADFQKFDTAMWTEWCRRYAYKMWLKKQPKKKRAPKPKLTVDPTKPVDLTQEFMPRKVTRKLKTAPVTNKETPTA